MAVAVSQQAVTDGITAPGKGITDMGALIIETVATAGFLAVILAATKRAPALAALAIPLTLVAIHFGIATLSGASVNPARSLGSAIVGGDLSKIWIYIVGPIVGGIIGWLAWRLIDGGAETYPAEQPGAEVGRAPDPGRFSSAAARHGGVRRAGVSDGVEDRQVARPGLGQPAGRLVPLGQLDQRRLLDPAAVERQRAARDGTGSPAGRCDGVRRLADEDGPLRPVADLGRVRRRAHRHERLGVRVARRADDLLGRADLHDLAEVHDGDPVGEHPGERQVVGDEQVGQAALLAQVEHQAQELGPDRHVEHRHGLVGDDELRVHDQRPGDHDALALAAGELVRVAAGEVGGGAEAGRLERRDHLRLALGPATTRGG